MDWNKIKENYPLAAKEAWDWHETFLGRGHKGFRWLYDFFDEQGMEMSITPLMDQEGYVSFMYNAHHKKIHGMSGTGTAREETEIEIFEKAFKLLNGRL